MSKPPTGNPNPAATIHPVLEQVSSRLCVLFLAAFAILGSFSAVTNSLTDHRLMPLFLFLKDHHVYYNPNQGPMYSTLYPPLSFIAYLPTAVFGSPSTAFLAAGAIAQFFAFSPLILAAFWAQRPKSSSNLPMLLCLTAFVLWCNLSEVMGTVYLVHADVPALFLAAVGLLTFAKYAVNRRTLLLVIAALCLSLAPWAKQTTLPVIFLVPLLLLVRRDFRGLGVYVSVFLLTQIVILLAVNATFDVHNMRQWLLDIPARQPWKAVWSTAVDESNRILLRENMAALVVLIPAFVTTLLARPAAGKWLTTTPWALFTTMGGILWPTSVIGYVKVGGAANTLLFTTYFLTVAVVLLVFDVLGSGPVQGDYSKILPPLLGAVFLLSVPAGITVAKSVLSPKRFLNSANVDAYSYSKRFPGKVYFPWHPLSVYLAEGNLYHFELGICDRQAAGIQIDRQNLREFIPKQAEFLAYKGTAAACTLGMLPEFDTKVELPDLPGWVVYRRTNVISK